MIDEMLQHVLLFSANAKQIYCRIAASTDGITLGTVLTASHSISTVPPTASICVFNLSASSLLIFSLNICGTLSTNFFA